ncbi:MAG: phosphatidate cytidylyltransferase [Oscillospiraceae bacterium]|nr:phosphatidate cytidylyltransferase [Oscillospiraceae bacterium]
MKKRVISGVVLILILCVCLFASKITRVLFFFVAAYMCAWELSTNLEKMDVGCQLSVAFVYLAGQAFAVLLYPDIAVYCIWFVICVFLAMVFAVLRKEVKGGGTVVTIAALGYPCMQFAVIMAICVGEFWLETLILAFFSTWICDCFALLGGMKFGKTRIAPEISPHKTVEGSICGAAASLVAGALAWLLGRAFGGSFLSNSYRLIPLWGCLVISLASSTAGQLGDLAESLIKRMIGIKDFSNIIPGHGGMLDRADSLLFSIPLTYALVWLLVGTH